jgi:hypothetical protein
MFHIVLIGRVYVSYFNYWCFVTCFLMCHVMFPNYDLLCFVSCSSDCHVALLPFALKDHVVFSVIWEVMTCSLFDRSYFIFYWFLTGSWYCFLTVKVCFSCLYRFSTLFCVVLKVHVMLPVVLISFFFCLFCSSCSCSIPVVLTSHVFVTLVLTYQVIMLCFQLFCLTMFCSYCSGWSCYFPISDGSCFLFCYFVCSSSVSYCSDN